MSWWKKLRGRQGDGADATGTEKALAAAAAHLDGSQFRLRVVKRDAEGVQRVEVFDSNFTAASLAHTRGLAALMSDSPERGRAAFNEACALLRSLEGPVDSAVLELALDVARQLESTGDVTSATDLLEHAVRLNDTPPTPEFSGFVDLLIGLGSLHEKSGNYSRAAEVQTRAAEQARSLPGEEVRLALATHCLGVAATGLRDFVLGERAFREAVATRERVLGEGHTETALSWDGLAKMLLQLGRPEEGLAAAQRAYDISLAAYGPDDANVARATETLAMAHKRFGDVDHAETLQRRAVAIYEGTVGASSGQTGVALGNLAGTLLQQRREAEAVPILYRALHVKELTFGPDHPSVAHTLQNLACIHAGRREFDTALTLARRAYHIRKTSLGPQHPETGQTGSLLVQIERDLKTSGSQSSGD